MQKSKVCVLGFLVALMACEVSYAGSFSFGGKKKKEEPKQQVSRQVQKVEAKKSELTEREQKVSDQSEAYNSRAGKSTARIGGGGPTTSILTKDNKPNLDRNPNKDIIRNPNASITRNPNLDIPRAPVVTAVQNPNAAASAAIPKNPNAGAVPRNPNPRK